jgi:uncharacterized protein YbaA (DUF1428 family)
MKKTAAVGRYVDGFVLVVPKRNLAKYRRLATLAGKVWIGNGALEYRECVGDDLPTTMVRPFPKMAKAKRGETVFFSWILYRNRAHRDRVNALVMKDPRMAKMMAMTPLFDIKRMAYGGFRVFVDGK